METNILTHLRRAPSLLLAPLLIALSLLVAWVVYQTDRDEQQANLHQVLRAEADLDWSELNARIQYYAGELMALKLQTIQQGLFQQTAADTDAIARTFQQAFTDTPELVQARWLDASGHEQVRLQRIPTIDGSRVQHSNVLQNKAGRYYFSESIKLDSNQIYASALDLNIEFGQVVEPLEPTLRLASPTLGASGQTNGVLVLNFNVSELLQRVAQAGDPRLSLQLVDEKGAWKVHTQQPELAWGDVLYTPARTMATEQPAVFAEVVALWRTENMRSQHGWEILQQIPLQNLFATPHVLFTLHSVTPAAAAAVNDRALTKAVWIFLLLFTLSSLFLFWARSNEKKRYQLAEQLEQQLQRTESASAYKTQFLANMSHEIRTPITAMLGMLELLRTTDLTAEQKQRVEFITSSTEDLRQVINDVLDFSKIEAGRIELHQRYFSLAETLEQVIHLFAASADLKDIDLLLEMEPELFTVEVYADSFRLGQVLNNLVSNGIKFTPEGSVRLKVDILYRNGDNLGLSFQVIDTGIGIQPEVIPKLCVPFEQGDFSITRQFGGTGLGLAIVNYLLSLMNARLEIDSVYDQGSNFGFTLNLPCKQHEQLAIDHQDSIPLQRVLVVDDQPLVCHSLAEMFRYWGVEAQEAFDGATALAMVRAARADKLPYDALVVDWQMPGTDGFEVLEQVRIEQQLHPELAGERLAVIMITESSRSELASSTRYRSDVPVLYKPVTMSSLQELLQEQGLIVATSHRVREDKEKLRQELLKRLQEQLVYSKVPRILLVEDNKNNQIVVKELLLSFGLDCDIAENGEQALLMTTGVSYDLILMDIQMPVMDGLTATRELRQRYDHRELPIVALSAATMETDIAAAEAAGVNAHMAKPIDVLKLLNVVLQFWKPDETSERQAPRPVGVDQQTPAGDSPDQPVPDHQQALDRLKSASDISLENTVYQWLGVEAYERVARGFLQDMLPQLNAWRGGEGPGGKHKFVHQLKSATGNIGAIRLQVVASQFEEQLKRDPELDITPLLDQLDGVCQLLLPLVPDVADTSESQL